MHILLLAIITIESVANQQDDMFLKQSEMYKLDLEDIADRVIPKESLVVINGTPSPQHMYFAHRKGWTETSEVIMSDNYLDAVSDLGAEYLIWDKAYGELPRLDKKVVYTDANFTISQISKSK